MTHNGNGGNNWEAIGALFMDLRYKTYKTQATTSKPVLLIPEPC